MRLVDDALLCLRATQRRLLARADVRVPSAARVVDHINRLGDAAEHRHQRQRAQQKAKFVFMIEVAYHIANGADIANDRRIGQRDLGDCPYRPRSSAKSPRSAPLSIHEKNREYPLAAVDSR